MSWIVVYTKPLQEGRTKENLERLGLEVYIPLRPIEKINGSRISIKFKPLFPRYIFISNSSSVFHKVVHMLRNIRGVSQIVKSGGKYAELGEETLKEIQNYENALLSHPLKAYQIGENLTFTHGAFRDVRAIFEEPDGDKRVILLFEILNKQVRLSVPVQAINRV
ncbi:MAG: transcription termination/antitermination NusG family protein [Burkholderiales bacterium]|nr:transcription termination/antitermination NusG family protein [Burkholderiales bacterium]